LSAPQGASQPFERFLSTSAEPGLHDVYVHALLWQLMPVALRTRVLQLIAQPPHCVTLSDVRVSQPVLPTLQCVYPVWHCQVQLPPVQLGVASTLLHTVPQLPQFTLSTAVSEHVPLQHNGEVPRHLFPQVLQLKRSVFGSTQTSPQQTLPPAQVVPPPHVSAHTPDSVHFFVPAQSPWTTQSTHR
jgi:hypothetical protein